jgi:tetratricopeptide (TPR) repeat protein
VAKQLRFLGRAEKALAMQQELLDEYARDEPGGEGFVHEEIAELHYAAGKIDAARPHFARAFELLGTIAWLEPDRLSRMKRLGRPDS